MNNPKRRSDNLDNLPNLPRINGELVFNSPWEARLFSMTLLLRKNESSQWTDFVGIVSFPEPNADKSPYYERWLTALEHTIIQSGLITGQELDRRTTEFSEYQLATTLFEATL
jgi:hypothetical protein